MAETAWLPCLRRARSSAVWASGMSGTQFLGLGNAGLRSATQTATVATARGGTEAAGAARAGFCGSAGLVVRALQVRRTSSSHTTAVTFRSPELRARLEGAPEVPEACLNAGRAPQPGGTNAARVHPSPWASCWAGSAVEARHPS